MYISASAFGKYYKRLRIKDHEGKKGSEQTTAIATLFAVDKCLKQFGVDVLDLVPKSPHRERLSQIFAELLRIHSDKFIKEEYQASDLGYIKQSKKTLEEKFGNNFLTTQLRQAASRKEPTGYPGRPKPLISLGHKISDSNYWGVKRAVEFSENLPVFFSDRICGYSTFAIILFLLRGYNLPDQAKSIKMAPEIIKEILQKEYSVALVSELIGHLSIPEEWEDAEFFSNTPPTIAELDSALFKIDVQDSDIVIAPKIVEREDEPENNIVFSEDLLMRVIASIKAGNHIILTGPPGTGKTTLALQIAKRVKGENQYEMYTATSNWSAFEVLGGYMPDPDDPKKLQYEAGFVVRNIDENKWTLIDEINRADVDKAFGELFTILSQKSVVLPYYEYTTKPDGTKVKKKVVIAPEGEYVEEEGVSVHVVKSDWRIIATMNSYDKNSLYQLSYAFMRRFAFIQVDAPTEEEMNNILDVAFAKADFNVDERSIIEDRLKALFCRGLFEVGMQIGAAIPISICNYIEERIKVEFPHEPLSDRKKANDIIIESITIFLLPQFEGKRKKHEEILSCLSQSLSIEKSSDDFKALSSVLATWTGHMNNG